MRQTFLVLACILMTTSLFLSCQDDNSVAADKLVSKQVLDQIWNLGYSNENVQKIDEGYLVEGDIILTEEDLLGEGDYTTIRIAQTEQYRTTNLITGLPRVFTVSLDSHFPSGYSASLDTAIARYNSRNLQISFTRVSGSSGNIHFKKQAGNYLASAGFPSSNGNPYPLIKLNSNSIGNGSTTTFHKFCGSIMAHEMGHCVGMRHTDYMNRAYSCGGAAYNEGSAGVGAILIPGTPSGPDANSWMLACISLNQNRPFNANDVIALNELY